jgi:uncharacterized membrane protein
MNYTLVKDLCDEFELRTICCLFFYYFCKKRKTMDQDHLPILAIVGIIASILLGYAWYQGRKLKKKN